MPLGTVGFGQQAAEIVVDELRMAQQRQGLAHVQDAEHLVGVLLEHGELVVVAGLQLLDHLFDGPRQVQRFHPRARRHHVVHGDGVQVEQVEQDAAVLVRNEIARFQHQRAQLLGRHPLLGRLARVDAHQPQQHRDERIDDGHQRCRQPQQWRDDEAGRKRDPLGIRRAGDFRRDLAEHDDQEGDDGRGDRQRGAAVAEVMDGQVGDQHRHCGIDQVVADQDQRQQLIGLAQQALRRAPATLDLARWRRRWRLSAIRLVSEIEKKAEQHSSSTTAPSCAHNGQESKADAREQGSAHYSRGVCRADGMRQPIAGRAASRPVRDCAEDAGNF